MRKSALPNYAYEYRGPQLVLFIQITTLSTYKTKPNLQWKAKKRDCITTKLLLFIKFFFG